MIAKGSIVVFRYPSAPSAALPRLFHVLDGPNEGMVRLDPLHPDDHREPLWDSVTQLIEVSHARLDEQGYVRIATNGSDDTAPTDAERAAFKAGAAYGEAKWTTDMDSDEAWRDYLTAARHSTGGPS